MHHPTLKQRLRGTFREAFIIAAPAAFVLLIIFTLSSCANVTINPLSNTCPSVDWPSYFNLVMLAAVIGALIGFISPKNV